MVILRVNFEMFREVVDALAEKRDLHFGRPGIVVVSSVVADNPRLTVLGKRHDRSSTNGPDLASSLEAHHTAVRLLTLVTRKTCHSKSVQPPGAKVRRPFPGCLGPPARRFHRAAEPIQPALKAPNPRDPRP